MSLNFPKIQIFPYKKLQRGIIIVQILAILYVISLSRCPAVNATILLVTSLLEMDQVGRDPGIGLIPIIRCPLS
jgi:hypothetical protein